MKIDLTIVQIALIFLPGIIWAGLDARFVAKKAYSPFETAINSFLFGVVCYVATFLAYGIVGKPFDVFDQIAANGQGIDFRTGIDEILVSTGLSLVLALAWIYASEYKILVRILQRLGATQKFGDEDVWDYVFNSNKPIVEYVYYRDFEKKLVYSGWVAAFSETDKLRELFLRDVEVYDFDGKLIFDSPHLYVSGKPDAMLIEFPYKPGGTGARNADQST